jgi:thiol-disulfide isomerase/thioredoxin
MALVFLLGISFVTTAQVEFIEVVTEEDMEGAERKGQEEGKMLFVDVYATWCGPCKMMDRDVYSDQEVGRFMNGHFINVRMDGETPFGRKYSAANGLQGFPSMFVFSSTGERVGQIVGFRPAGELLTTLGGMVENFAAVRKYRIDHQQGTLQMSDYPGYIKALQGMGMENEAEELAAEYISKRKGVELSDDDIRVVAYYSGLNDPWWSQFSADRDRLKRVLSEEFKPAMDRIYSNTLSDAVEKGDLELVSRMASELSPLMEGGKNELIDQRSLPFIQYYYYAGLMGELTGYVDRRFAADRKDDHRWLCGATAVILGMDQQKLTPVILQKGVECMTICLGYEENYDYCFYMGMVLLFQQRMNEAEPLFQKAATMAVGEEEKAMIDQVLRYIGSR